MKITSEPVRTMFGKRTGSFRAMIPGTEWSAEAKTKPEALEALHLELERAAEFSQTRKYIRVKGATFALFYARGWQYDIIHDENPERYGSCALNVKSYGDALEAMLNHVKQYNP